MRPRVSQAGSAANGEQLPRLSHWIPAVPRPSHFADLHGDRPAPAASHAPDVPILHRQGLLVTRGKTSIQTGAKHFRWPACLAAHSTSAKEADRGGVVRRAAAQSSDGIAYTRFRRSSLSAAATSTRNAAVAVGGVPAGKPRRLPVQPVLRSHIGR